MMGIRKWINFNGIIFGEFLIICLALGRFDFSIEIESTFLKKLKLIQSCCYLFAVNKKVRSSLKASPIASDRKLRSYSKRNKPRFPNTRRSLKESNKSIFN